MTPGLQFLKGDPSSGPAGGLTDEDLEEDDLDEDVLDGMAEDRETFEKSIYKQEIAYVEDFMSSLKFTSTGIQGRDAPVGPERALASPGRPCLCSPCTRTPWITCGRSCDPSTATRSHAIPAAEARSGTAGRYPVHREEIKRDFKSEKINILLGTDALSEGLNLQTCGVMINFDMPGNPCAWNSASAWIHRIREGYDEGDATISMRTPWKSRC